MIKLGAYHFTYENWRAGSLTEFGVKTRTYFIELNRNIIRKNAIGYIKGEKLYVRPKRNTVAVMFWSEHTNAHFWTHLTEREFNTCFPDINLEN